MSEAAENIEEGLEEQPELEANDNASEETGSEGVTDEELARSLGWRPKAEYEGDKPWKDFQEFLDERENNLQFARVTNSRLRKLNRDLTRQNKRMAAAVEQVKGFEERAYQRALADLKAKQEQAVEEGDTDAFRKLDKEIDELRDARPKAEGNAPDVDTGELFTEWLIDNPWYSSDKLKQQYADLQFQKLGGMEGYDGSPDELLAEVTERVSKRFAGKEEEKPAPKKINPVGGANGMRQAPKANATYASLNQEEKQMAQNMVKMGIFKSVDDYAKELRKNG